MTVVLGRRQTLALLGAAALARATRAWAACEATRPATPGPFWLDDNLLRSDIRTDPSDGTARPGVPLTLRLKVLRSDAACLPAAGTQVDVWQCDAGGTYSDEPGGGTPGGRFLRGYQITDTTGAVEFTTIYPGWYPGRTIHVHYRVRSGDVDFTSQLHFDDAISDQVLANAPYAARGPRDRTNDDDALFDPSTILALAPDGSGGWVGTFDVALAGLSGIGCVDPATCYAALALSLPDPSIASGRKARKVATRIARLYGRAGAALDRAATASGARRRRQYVKATSALSRLGLLATSADEAGTLGVPLGPLMRAVHAVVVTMPPA